MDIDIQNRTDWEHRRKIRLAQVRNQSKDIAKKICDRVQCTSQNELEHLQITKFKADHKYKSLVRNKLKSDFNYLIQDIGNGYSLASVETDPSIQMAEKRLVNRCKAISRGTEAMQRQNRILEEKSTEKEMKEKRVHFNKTVEKIRSALITSVPFVDNEVNSYDANKHNKCLLLQSQTILTESSIPSWNYKMNNSKPWSRVIESSKENRNHNDKKCLSIDGSIENKEAETKIANLENDVNSYESLVSKLKKLSAEELNIRNKLPKHSEQDISVSIKNINKKENVKYNDQNSKLGFSGNSQLNEKQSKLDANVIINQSQSSSSMSPALVRTSPKRIEVSIKKKHSKNEPKVDIKKRSTLKTNMKSPKAKIPLKNINNIIERVNQKKRSLANELSANIKKTENLTNTKQIPMINRTKGSDDLKRKCNTVSFANLPQSNYDSQLEASKNKSKWSGLKCDNSVNVELMRLISSLLKMSPIDIHNLSVSMSSDSSIRTEASVAQDSNDSLQYYNDLLNTISECLNTELSDISQDTALYSPININTLNRLQKISEYYLEKTEQIRSICEETPQFTTNDNLNKTCIEETINQSETDNDENIDNSSLVSSKEPNYVLEHINTLLQQKGLIRQNYEWPLFKNDNSDDDNRSLTDQLLDINH
ncbi:putative autophagy-related protein 11 [Adelges cooleyi]|uniref:putative autophagy-related protein 11 n=1 Tax=Adelges cooleyi TaxID=133065 RepID=UPI00217FAAFE|nr:putative autophagy-related protein 11 [Adelges cooleyi]